VKKQGLGGVHEICVSRRCVSHFAHLSLKVGRKEHMSLICNNSVATQNLWFFRRYV